MVGLGPTIHVFADTIKGKTWMVGPRPSPGHASPAMKEGRTSREVKRLLPDAP
jgi:hypothetical protein